MAFSGGTFSRTFDCTTDRDNGVKILASKFDTELDGMATGLSTTILKDGTQTCTAAIPFAQGITIADNKTITLGTNSDVTIQYDETTNDSLEIAANVEGAALGIVLKADQGDDAGDEWKLNIADGGTLTLGNDINSAGTYVTHLTITPNATVASSTTAVAGNLTIGGALTLGSGAVISEAELETIDGITPGTAAASKAMVLDASLDISGGRNLTISGELDAATLDISGDADIDGTLEADAITIGSTSINSIFQPLDAQLTDVAGLAVTDSGFIVGDGSNFVLETGATVRTSLGLGTAAVLNTGIANTNIPKFTSGVSDDDFLRVSGTAIEGRSAAEVLSDIGASAVAGSGSIVTTGALNAGSITSGFGAIDNGSSAITTTGVITGGTLEATTDTAAGDNAAIGYTAAEGLILTGQGSTSDITLKNDADATVFTVPTGTDDILFPDGAKAMFGAGSDLQIYHDGSHSYVSDAGTGNLQLSTNGTAIKMLRGNGEVLGDFNIGGSVDLYHSNAKKFETTSTGVDVTGNIDFSGGILASNGSVQFVMDKDNNGGEVFVWGHNASDATTNELMRINADGDVAIGKTSNAFGTQGFFFDVSPGQLSITCNQNSPLRLNRVNNDGTVVSIQGDGSEEGTISISGGTVSYNGGHLSRWSHLPDGEKDDTILKGTVLTNLDDMCHWVDSDGNVKAKEQLNQVQISSVEGDKNVAGVMVNWCDGDEAQYPNTIDLNMAMTGDMVIRIAQGTTVARGDLLMSAGDGTAKPQGDDIVRSKTIAKVTSINVSHTYDDGSYCVPCVLMAC